jgi:hypothetical protein
MRRSVAFLGSIVSALVLCGCSHTITMFPRGGGETGTGSLNDGTREVVVYLKGKTYSGKFVRNESYGVGATQGISVGGVGGIRQGFGTTAVFGSGNQASALLISGSDLIRCDLIVVNASDGSGVCSDQENRIYDVLIK